MAQNRRWTCPKCKRGNSVKNEVCSKCGANRFRCQNKLEIGGVVKSKCCGTSITIGDCASACDKCGNSVNPDTGEPYGCKTSQFGGINLPKVASEDEVPDLDELSMTNEVEGKNNVESNEEKDHDEECQ